MRDAVDASIENMRDAVLAAILGCLTVLQNLLQRGHLDKTQVCQWAAWGGHLQVLQWLRENDCPWDEDTCTDAAQGGHLEVLKWSRENGCPWNIVVVRAHATKGRHLEMVEWLRSMVLEEARD